MRQNYPSTLLEEAVNELSRLPGVGRKSALRLVLHLLRQPIDTTSLLTHALQHLRQSVCYCKVCQNISDTEVCNICANPSRQRQIICVVENVREVMAIENTQQFHGLYHVLGGVISPIDGIAPGDLSIDKLVERVAAAGIEEVVLALSTTMEGDTTNFYLYKRLQPYAVKITTLSRGLAVGDELEYADELTLGRSILNRTPFHQMYPLAT